MPIRMLVSDIDGTLVRLDKSLPEANVNAMRSLMERGVIVSLISARPPTGIMPIARQLGVSGAMAAFNGGTIFDGAGTALAVARLPAETARALLALYDQPGITRWVTAAGHWLTSDIGNPHTPREILSAGLQPEQTDDFSPWLAQIDKLVAVCDDDGLMDQVELSAQALARDQAAVVRSQDYYLDATAPSANKGDGVAALAAHYGITLEEVAVIGDQANDIAMFRRAGLAIAMGQAKTAVKDEADAVAASNEDNGVADAIARFIVPRIG